MNRRNPQGFQPLERLNEWGEPPVLIFQPMLVATGSEDEEGHLALYDGKLIGVFVRLAGVEHLEDRGRLYLEASFGQLSGLPAPTFLDLAEAARWIETELGPLNGHEVPCRAAKA